MYSEPRFNVIKLGDEDILTTSQGGLESGGETDIGNVPGYEWPDKKQ